MKLAAALATAAVALLAVGGWFVLSTGGSRDASPGAAARERSNGDGERSPLPPAAVAERRASSLIPERTDALAVQWNDASHDVVGPVVEGTIVVLDREGVKHDEEDGSFVPDFIDGPDSDLDDSARKRVAVKHGRFRFDARGATVMLVTHLELGRCAAVVDRGVELAAGNPAAIDARWIDDLLLHVVDATTHQELSDVTVARDSTRLDPPPEHPGVVHPIDLFVTDVRSPVRLTRATAFDRLMLPERVWVGANGHAWQRVVFDFEHDRERTVELGPAGSLAVVVNVPADTESSASLERLRHTDRWPRLRLRRSGATKVDPLIADASVSSDDVRFDGLAPGDLTASIEIGDPVPWPLLVSHAAVTITAGATARVTLTLDATAAPKPTFLAGTLFVPTSWGEIEMGVVAEPVELFGASGTDWRKVAVGDVEPMVGREGGWHWRIDELLPGTYELFVGSANFVQRVEVGKSGRDDVVLRLPEPALLRVRFVDEETQEPLEVTPIAWVPSDYTTRHNNRFSKRRGHGIHFDFFETMLAFDSETHCSVATVAAGRGRIAGEQIMVPGSELVGSTSEYVVASGVNEIVVPLRKPCGVEIEVKRRERLGAISFEWTLVDATDGSVRGVAIVQDLFPQARVYLPRPGRYRFTRSNVDEPAPDLSFEIDVPKGEIVKKTIEIDRK